MAMNDSYRGDIETIENLAETKGIEVDDIEVIEPEEENGAVTFRIYETKAETEADSIGVDVSKPPGADDTGSVMFRDNVQTAMSNLKKYLSGDGEEQVEDVEVDEADEGNDSSDDVEPERRGRSRRTSDGPGSRIDARMDEMEDRIEAIEDRLDGVESNAEVVDNLQQLLGGNE